MTQAPTLFLDGSARIEGSQVFDSIRLSIKSGQWTCLLGSSGVGKSTVLRLFAGLGDGVHFEGAYGAEDGPLEGRVAFMAQDDLLMPWLSAMENVLIGARLRGDPADLDRAQRVLERVGLGDKAKAKPAELSGGQRQRVALARTLMEDRPVVLLDEPFSALDARTRAAMQELACEVLDGRTVLLVTHDPAEAARLGDAIHIMTQTDIEDVVPPLGQSPRPVDAPEVLAVQAQLLARLRESV